MIDNAVADFRLSITRALSDQLVDALRPLRPTPLTASNVEALLPRSGVYVLYLDGVRVYVGKASNSLQDRLSQHLRKISGRGGLASSNVEFICAYIEEDLDAAAPERLLIKVYQEDGELAWNKNGFGNKDPGRKRDDTLVKDTHFDAIYPIDLDHEIEFPQLTWNVDSLLAAGKQLLPYNFRFDVKGRRTLYRGLSVTLPAQRMTARSLLIEIVRALPAGWQATALPGYTILYEEERTYGSALTWWRKDADGEVIEVTGPRRFERGPVTPEDEDES